MSKVSDDKKERELTLQEEMEKIIETAKAEARAAAEEIINQAKEEAGKILNSATKKEFVTVPTSVEKNEERAHEMVTIRLFKDNGKYKDDVFVGVNDKRYQIKRGIEVEVPRFVAEVLENSQKQDDETMEYISKLEADYEKKSVNLQ
ncbi:MAG: hypothetical protein ACOCNC_11420 [Acetivibrio ethanolgignens]